MRIPEHRVVTRWDDLKGRVELTYSDNEKMAMRQAQVMEADGFLFDTDFCSDSCPRCLAGYSEPGGAVA